MGGEGESVEKQSKGTDLRAALRGLLYARTRTTDSLIASPCRGQQLRQRLRRQRPNAHPSPCHATHALALPGMLLRVGRRAPSPAVRTLPADVGSTTAAPEPRRGAGRKARGEGRTGRGGGGSV